MCGLVGVVRRPPEGAPPELAPLLKMLEAAGARLGVEALEQWDAGALNEAAAAVHAVARTLRGPLGADALLADPVAMAAFEHRAAEITVQLGVIEATLDATAATDGNAKCLEKIAAHQQGRGGAVCALGPHGDLTASADGGDLQR